MFCKFCGYEYDEEDLRFCPSCGKKLSNEDNWVTASKLEENNEETSDKMTDKSKEEIAVTVVDTAQPSISANNTEEEPLGSIFKKWGWKIMEYGFAIILGAGILFWAIEAATGFPIKDRVLGMNDTEAQPIYKKASNIIRNRIPFDVDIPKFKSKYVWHRGVRTEKFEQGEIRLDAYVATIPVTFHFDKYVDREVDVKIWFWKFDEDDNSMEVYSKFDGLKEGIKPIKLWDTDRKFGEYKDVNIYMKEVYESWEDLLTVIFNEIQRSYNNSTERDNRYPHYADEYLYPRIMERYINSDDEKEPLTPFANYVNLNFESLNNKYPELFEENPNYIGDSESDSDSYEEEDYTNDEYIDDTDSYDNNSSSYENDAYYDSYHEEYDYYDYDEDAIKKAALKKIKPSLSVLNSASFANMDIVYPEADECTLTYEKLMYKDNTNTWERYGGFIVTIPVSITFETLGEKEMNLCVPVLELNQIETSPEDIDMAIQENDGTTIVRPFWGVPKTVTNQADTQSRMVANSRNELITYIMTDLTSRRSSSLNYKSSKEFYESNPETYLFNSVFGNYLECMRYNHMDLDEKNYKAQCLSAFFSYINLNYDWLSEKFPKLCKEYAKDEDSDY